MTLQPNFSSTSSQKHSLSFSQHFSYPMPLLLVQLLLHIDTSWPLSPILYCLGHYSVLPKLIPLFHSVYHISFTSSIGCHLQSQVLKTIPQTRPININQTKKMARTNNTYNFILYNSCTMHNCIKTILKILRYGPLEIQFWLFYFNCN